MCPKIDTKSSPNVKRQNHWILPVSLACLLAWNLSGMEEAGIEGRRRFDAGCRVQQTGLSGHLRILSAEVLPYEIIGMRQKPRQVFDTFQCCRILCF